MTEHLRDDGAREPGRDDASGSGGAVGVVSQGGDEDVALQREELEIRQRADGGGSRNVSNERDLAERFPGTEHPDTAPVRLDRLGCGASGHLLFWDERCLELLDEGVYLRVRDGGIGDHTHEATDRKHVTFRGDSAAQDPRRRRFDYGLAHASVDMPPVCRVLDYSKYKYEQEQKAKAARKHQQQVNVREIKLRPKIATNDYETKKNHVVRFLKGDDRVKVTIMFRGREQTHPERGEALLMRLTEDVAETLYQEADRWWSGTRGREDVRPALADILRTWAEHASLLGAVVEASTYDEEIGAFWRGLVGRFIDATERRLVADGRLLPAELVLWAAGVKASRMSDMTPPPLGRARRASS